MAVQWVNIYAGPHILSLKENAMENLARYITRASFSLERMSMRVRSLFSLSIILDSFQQ